MATVQPPGTVAIFDSVLGSPVYLPPMDAGLAVAQFPLRFQYVPASFVPPTTNMINAVHPYAYGAVCDGLVISDITTSNGGPISSASYQFRQRDIGKLISIPGAIAGVTGNPLGYLNTTIQSVPNGQAVLASAPTQVIAGTAVATFGTDDTAAIQKAVNAAALFSGTLDAPAAIIIISSVTWPSNVSCYGQGINATIFKHIMTTDAVGAMFFNNTGGSTTPFNCQFSNLQMDMEAATAVGGYNVFASCIRITQAVRNYVFNCYIHGSPATALAFDFGQGIEIIGNEVENCGRLAAAGSLGGAGVGCAINPTSQWVVIGNTFKCPAGLFSNYSVFFEAESAASAAGAAVVMGNNFVGYSLIAAVGDCGLRRFDCVGNHFDLPTGSTNTGSGIAVRGGTTGFLPGIRGKISNNVITSAPGDGITIDYTAGIDSGQYAGYDIDDNHIQAVNGNGIKLTANSAAVTKSLQIRGNTLDGNHTCGIVFLGTGGFANVVINDNVCMNNCSAGAGITSAAISFDVGNVADLMMVGNRCYDNNTGTQKYGIAIGAAVTITDAFINDNKLNLNATGSIHSFGGTIAGVINDNPGYNPVGASAATPSASPWTFTAPTSRGTLLLAATTAITALTKNGANILVGTVGANVPYDISFAANDSVVVTYTGTLSAVQDVA